MTDLDPMAVALRLAAALDQEHVPYAIGGALAYGLWGDPRGTHDVDLNLFVDAEMARVGRLHSTRNTVIIPSSA